MLEHAEDFGRRVGEKIQHGIEFYLGFMKNTHWDTLGGKLADYLTAYVEDTFGELSPYRVATISLTPRGETAWDYTDSVLHERKICRVVGALCLLAGSGMLFAALKKRGL